MAAKDQLERMVDGTGQRAVVLLSYNSVDGFAPGVHGEGRVLVYSWDKSQKKSTSDAPAVARQITDQLYDAFNLRQDAGLFEHVFVYTGMNGIDESIQAARMIDHDWKLPDQDGKKVTMVGCGCDYGRKRQVAHGRYSVGLIKGECGGEATMGRIATLVLRGVNPKQIGDYGRIR